MGSITEFFHCDRCMERWSETADSESDREVYSCCAVCGDHVVSHDFEYRHDDSEYLQWIFAAE